MLLWEEYCEKCKREGEKACSYPAFAKDYKRYTGSRNYTSHVAHKPGLHLRLTGQVLHGKRTEPSHLPYPQYIPETIKSTTAKAEKIGANAKTVVLRIYESAKIKEQALMDVRTVLDIAGIYGEDMPEEACQRALYRSFIKNYN